MASLRAILSHCLISSLPKDVNPSRLQVGFHWWRSIAHCSTILHYLYMYILLNSDAPNPDQRLLWRHSSPTFDRSQLWLGSICCSCSTPGNLKAKTYDYNPLKVISNRWDFQYFSFCSDILLIPGERTEAWWLLCLPTACAWQEKRSLWGSFITWHNYSVATSSWHSLWQFHQRSFQTSQKRREADQYCRQQVYTSLVILLT